MNNYFRAMVESDMKVKDVREYVINLFESYPSKYIKGMNVQLEEDNELSFEVDDTTLTVTCEDYFIGSISIKPRELTPYDGDGEGLVRIKVRIPIVTKYTFNPAEEPSVDEDNFKDTKTKIYRSKAEILEVYVDEKSVKLDKKTSTRLGNIFKKVKFTKEPLLDIKRTTTKKSVFMYIDVRSQYNKVLNRYTKLQRNLRKEEIKKDNVDELKRKKATSFIAKKENTSPDFIVAVSKEFYVVFNAKGFNHNNVIDLLNDYDTALWAKDFNYDEGIEDNKIIIRTLAKFSTGKLVYTTSPMGIKTEETIEF